MERTNYKFHKNLFMSVRFQIVNANRWELVELTTIAQLEHRSFEVVDKKGSYFAGFLKNNPHIR